MAEENLPQDGAVSGEPVVDAAAPAADIQAASEAAVAPEPSVIEAEPAAAEGGEPAPAAEAAPAVEAKPAEEKPAEAAKPDAAPAEGEGVQAAPAPAYQDFTLPEGLQAAPEQMTAFTGVLGKYGLTQEAGQELMDLHAETLRQMQTQMEQRQQDVFAETRRGWVAEFEKGAGNRRDTILNDAKFTISEVIKDPKERAELWNVFAFTGAGDHPAVINALAKVAKKLRERTAPASPVPQTPERGANQADRSYRGRPQS